MFESLLARNIKLSANLDLFI